MLKYDFKENIFAQINSSEKVYWQVCRGEQEQTRNKHFRYMTEEEREEFKNG